jgi:hypothetical protein
MALKQYVNRINNILKAKRDENIEKITDIFFEHYHTIRSRDHLNRILHKYSRNPQCTYKASFEKIRCIGLYHPYADSIKYLKHMRSISTMKKN